MIVTTHSTLAQLAGALHPRTPSTQAVWASEWNLAGTSNTGADLLKPASLSCRRCCSWDILQMDLVYQSRVMARGPTKHLGIPSPRRPCLRTLFFDDDQAKTDVFWHLLVRLALSLLTLSADHWST